MCVICGIEGLYDFGGTLGDGSDVCPSCLEELLPNCGDMTDKDIEEALFSLNAPTAIQTILAIAKIAEEELGSEYISGRYLDILELHK